MERGDQCEVTVYVGPRGEVSFGAGSTGAVVGLETAFPGGTWRSDEEGRPLYHVTGMRFGGTIAWEPTIRQTLCDRCGLDVEGTPGAMPWTDRGGESRCRDGRPHYPYRGGE